MIYTDRHAAWLGDRGAQQKTERASRALAVGMAESPLMRGLDRDLAGLTDRSPASIVAVARRFFNREQDIRALLDALTDGAWADPFFLPPLHPLSSDIHSGLLLYDHPDLAIAIGVTPVDMLAAKKTRRNGPGSIVFTGMWNLFRYLQAGDALVAFWEAPRIAGGFRSADAGRCRCVERREMVDGDEFVVDGSRQSFIIEHARADILYLQAMIRCHSAPLAAEYDSDTRRLIGATSTDEASSRVQMMATLLRHLERADAVPLLREQLAGANFFTRWHLMRELLALDADAAHPDLRRMAATDPHAEVRAAAQQTLQLFFTDTAAARDEDALCPA